MASRGGKAIPATVSKMTVYKAEGDTDQTEGRGGWRTIGHFADEEIAKRAVKGEGVMGCDGYVKSEDTLVVVFHDPKTGDVVTHKLGPRVHLEFEDPKEVRAKALAKLSEKEKKALGLL